jgi:hypothetical protein
LLAPAFIDAGHALLCAHREVTSVRPSDPHVEYKEQAMVKTSMLVTAVAAVLSATLCLRAAAEPVSAQRKTLTAFASDQELADTLKRWAEEMKRRRDAQARRTEANGALANQQSAPPAAPALAAAKVAAAAEADSVTNVQHAGVDEGGIVKVHGDHLVVLRRGRLFTVRIGDNQLKPVAALDAFGPGIDPQGAWYDEMLISGNDIVVIGYSYARGGSEIGLFAISSEGQLSYKGTYHLRSNDYYSSRNYASRLVGDKLIMYSPLYLNPYVADPFADFPAMRRWHTGATAGEFKRIAPATRIYRTDEPLDVAGGLALHSVTVCQLAKPELQCESTAVLGAPGRVFYVSPGSVYVWTTPWRRFERTGAASQNVVESSVFRIPLDGSAPSAIKTTGSPIDQFSFLEGDDGYLNVLVRSNGRGDGMWLGEANPGDLALMRVSLASFSDGKDSAPQSAYQRLPKPEGHAVQSRYVGKYLLYGAGTGWQRAQSTGSDAEIYAVRYAEQSAVYSVPLGHSVDRIEALGAHAVAVGSDGRNLHFTSLRLGRYPVAAGTYTRNNAAQGETRSHGFFYRPESEQDGLLGLPIIGGEDSAAGQLTRTSASLLYLRNRGLAFSELGTLEARPGSNRDDGCRASCVDWYGNARPLFVRERVFALLGYEIVEGTISGKRIIESRRINFAVNGRNLVPGD